MPEEAPEDPLEETPEEVPEDPLEEIPEEEEPDTVPEEPPIRQFVVRSLFNGTDKFSSEVESGNELQSLVPWFVLKTYTLARLDVEAQLLVTTKRYFPSCVRSASVAILYSF